MIKRKHICTLKDVSSMSDNFLFLGLFTTLFPALKIVLSTEQAALNKKINN